MNTLEIEPLLFFVEVTVMQRPGLKVSILVPKASLRRYSMVKRPGMRCSRSREGMEHAKHVRREESDGAKSVVGPFQPPLSVVRDGAAVASSLKPR